MANYVVPEAIAAIRTQIEDDLKVIEDLQGHAGAGTPEFSRLSGKREGIKLALARVQLIPILHSSTSTMTDHRQEQIMTENERAALITTPTGRAAVLMRHTDGIDDLPEISIPVAVYATEEDAKVAQDFLTTLGVTDSFTVEMVPTFGQMPMPAAMDGADTR